MSEEWVTLARIVRPQGRRGEVLADLLTDFPDQFKGAVTLLMWSPDGSRVPAQVEEYWMPTGRNAGRVVLKLAGIETISDAETLTGREIHLQKAARVSLAEDTFYVADLVGCSLVDQGNTIGRVEDIHFPLDPAGLRLPDVPSLFVVQTPDRGEILVPFANAFVQRIDTAAKVIEMTLPEGLLDLNG